MIRFFINFILFGLLFFLIHRFFPQAFETLVGWVGNIWDFLVHYGTVLIDAIRSALSGTPAEPPAGS